MTAVQGLAMAVTLLVAAGCADLTMKRPVDAINAPIANPSFARDIQPILTETCASSNICHSGPSPQPALGGMSLEAGSSYTSLVGAPSSLVPSLRRVAPAKPDSSLVLLVLSAPRGSVRRMPLTTYPLPDAVVQTIRNWIQNGAPNN